MKFLKYLLLFILALLIIGLVYISMQPAAYNVTRSKIIEAPITTTFNTINNLKTWEEWGPWHEEDTTIVVTYGDKKIGLNASSSWTGKDGPGNMITTKIVPNKRIEQKLQFGNNKPSDIIWMFEQVEQNTKITWQMKDNKAPFMFKMIAAMVGGWDKMLGPMQEKGLENLAKVITKTANTFTLSKVTEIKITAQNFIGYPVKMKINHTEMTKVFSEKMPKAGVYATKNGLKLGDYIPAAVYTKYDEKNQETEFYIGLILNKPLTPSKEMTALNLPAGKAIKISKYGNYGVGDYQAHTAIASYLTENKISQTYPIWETYPNNPTTVKPTNIQTDIYYPIQ